ncbi:hypothetical protein CEQ90_02095 [Lewinellaceae bacterium SD302]|nr:hypothetical protein CEQ90_02095 [Lewinellaceae bacterium SD302]
MWRSLANYFLMFNKLYNGSSMTTRIFSRMLLLFILGVLINNYASAQTDRLIISEVTASGEIEIFNGTGEMVNVGPYWLCNFPAYDQLESLTVDCGDLNLQPGATVVVSGWDAFDSNDAEIGLYSSAAFSNSAAIVSYVEYGSAGHQRSAVAVAAGIWETGMFLTAPIDAASIQTQANAAGDLSYVNIMPTPCTPDASLLPAVVVDGGAIALADGSTETSICVDGVADPLEVVRDGNGEGPNREFVITDDIGTILALPGAGMNGPFDLDPAGPGTCEIWYLAYEDGLEGLEVGNNLLSDLEGNSDLSNPITVIRQAADGGTVSLIDGSTVYTGDAGDIVIDVTFETTATALSYWYVITDDNDIILAFANSAETNTLDLSGAPVGECHVWGWSYRGEGDPVPGDNISTLNDGDCEEISANFITVIRNPAGVVNGGALELTDGSTETSICVDGVADPIEVIRDGNGAGANREFVITDDIGTILALPGAGMNGPFDLDPAGPGTCEIWYLAYEDGLENLEEGNNLDQLVGVFALSNPITVIRQAPDGGEVTLANGETTYTGEVGDIVIDVQHTTTATALSYWYIITDESENILAFANSAETSTLDLSGAPVGECHVWGWSYRGEGDPVPGDNISTLNDGDCETISDNFITVTRQEPNAVNRFGEEIGIQLFPNPVSEALNVRIDGLDRNEARFDVYNLQGQRILSQVTNHANGTNAITTANLPSGSYVLRIVSGGQLISRRFSK